MKNEIKNLKYFMNKLKSFLKKYSNDDILTIRDKYTRDEIIDLIKEIEEYINKAKKEDLENDILSCYKKEFINIINDMKEEINFNRNQTKPIKTDLRTYNEKVYTKLNYLFRKQELLSYEEAKEKYEYNYNFLYEKYSLFLELLNWLNDNGLSIIPEKTLFSAYLGISVDTYNDILKFASDIRVRQLFISIDEYFTTNQFGALISDNRSSLERIQKIEKFGQEMRQTQPDNLIVNNTANISYSDLMLDIKRKMDAIEYKGDK